MSLLEQRKIGKLLREHTFYIPAYQRGYRWKADTQVRALLDDIWDYETESKETDAGYCLQPVVVRKMKEREYELIDGQQRLTTILLLLHYMNEYEFKKPRVHYAINFETRLAQQDFLSDLEDADKAGTNIDLYHLHEAYKEIIAWFDKAEFDNPAIRGIFYDKLVNQTWVIWYEPDTDDNTTATDIFTRLNMGKIQLTNAELVKALFLNNADTADDNSRQIILAAEWDDIERKLQNSKFWYFICPSPNDYVTRIDYIFDLIYDKKKEDEDYFTFYEFSKSLKNGERSFENGLSQEWLRVKSYFLRLQDWYEDHTLYHLTGYLIAVEEHNPVRKLLSLAREQSKSKFRQLLRERAQITISGKKSFPEVVENLVYGEDTKTVKSVLLLFNILSILQSGSLSQRFPFDAYKMGKWDIEHIHSQNTKDISYDDRKHWVNTMLWYFTGLYWDGEIEEQHSQTLGMLPDTTKAICAPLVQLHTNLKDENAFFKAYDQLATHFDTQEDGFTHGVGNLTLLDSQTNRLYKNAFFPVKRKWILEREKEGIFVPLCTKNVFLKAYSKTPDNLLSWNEKDAIDYINQIKTILEA